MAYFSQEMKQEKAPKVKAICEKYGVKASLAIDSRSTVVVNISEGVIDFVDNYNKTIGECYPTDSRPVNKQTSYIQVNSYWYHKHFSDDAKAFLTALFAVLNEGNWDKSDLQVDYFDVGWYVRVNIGRWNKPYRVTA